MREDLHGDVSPRWTQLPSRYIYAQEKLSEVLPDLQRLVKEQWAETGDPSLPCNPNWALYQALERANHACLIVCRRDGNAVGYVTTLLHPHMNSQQTMVGTISTYYAPQNWLRAVILRGLLRTATEWLVARGAKQVFAETEYQHSAGKLLERLGFTPVKIGYKLSMTGETQCQILA